MNKTTKKLLVSLLSVLMVLSCMPAMAFAEIDPSEIEEDHSEYWELDKDSSTAATHDTYGLNVYKCTADGCEATYTSIAEPTYHVYSDNTLGLAKEDYIERVTKEQELDPLEVLRMTLAYNDYCYVYVQVCDECGELYFDDTFSKRVPTHGPAGDGLKEAYITWKSHEKTDDSVACALTYTCKNCGKEYLNEGWEDSDAYHDYGAPVVVGENICGDGEATSGYKVSQKTCKDCKYVKTITAPMNGTDTATGVQHKGLGKPKWASDSEWEKAVPNYDDRVAMMPYMIRDFENKLWYDPNEIDKLPTCTVDGEGSLVCANCGETFGTCDIKATGHSVKTIDVPATCEDDKYTYTYCENCTEYTAEKKITPNTKLGHDYSVEVVTKPSCVASGITLISCSRCGDGYDYKPFITADYAKAEGMIVMVDAEGYITENEKLSKGLYFIGFNKELTEDGLRPGVKKISSKAIKVEDWAKDTHDWGKYETMTEATCEKAEVQAMKCSKCGLFYVHATNPQKKPKSVGKPLGHEITTEVVAPTCGTAGYSYDTCTRCKLLIDHTTGKAEDAAGDPWALEDVKYNPVPALVAEGTPCTYEWKVTKAPTATEDGEKALVCTKCNAVKDGSQTVVPKDSDEAKNIAIDAATPVIEAAANVISDKANYKTDSVKAIEEAKAALNQAIASGNAADVQRATAALQKAVEAAAKKDANPMTAKGKTVKAKANKKTTFKKAKAFTVKKAQGKVTFKKKSGNAKVTVSKAGKVTVKKGLKKGKTYKIKVKVTAAGNGNYLAKTKTVTLKVKVK